MLDLKYDIVCLTYTVNATLQLNGDLIYATTFIKISSGIYRKDTRTIYLSVQSCVSPFLLYLCWWQQPGDG